MKHLALEMVKGDVQNHNKKEAWALKEKNEQVAIIGGASQNNIYEPASGK